MKELFVMSLKNEYVVVRRGRCCDQVLSATTHPTRLGAVEGKRYAEPQDIEVAQLLYVNVAKGYATMMRYSPERGYFRDTLPAYRLCSKMERAAAAEAEAEAKMWAGCPRNYLSYC